MKLKTTRRTLVAVLMCAGLSVPAVAAVPDSVYLFAYNANPGSGLSFAYSANQQTWTSIGGGRSFLGSDYGDWGRQKKMFNPCLLLKADGTWLCVFQVNDDHNQFAVTSSPDLLVWRPQDYPYLDGVSSCIAPVLTYDSTAAIYKIVFKTEEGDVYETTSSDCLHFAKPQKSTSAFPNIKEEAKVNGVTMQGQVFKVPYDVAAKMITYAQNADYWGQYTSELAADNEVRFANLRPLEANIVINAGNTKPISDKLIGIFFEDINYSADGGLYAELIQNRDFEYSRADRGDWGPEFAWTLEGNGGSMEIRTENPIHDNNPHYVALNVTSVGNVALMNSGFDGIVVRKGEKYDLSLFAKQLEGNGGKLKVSIVADGNTIAEATLKAPSSEWQTLSATLKANVDAQNASLRVEPQGVGTVGLDMISLFPQNTFKGHKNGLRADLAQALADLKPKFMRFPGGCVAHGNGLDNIYRWKETIGPLEARKPQFNIWNYHQTKGLGYYEYFLFCEDIGCEPLPVLAAGVCCQNSSRGGYGQQGGINMDDMDDYVQDVLDLIEWANGDAKTTEWGKIRAKLGHPQPFNLKYIGIGNEDLISKTFEERYLMIVNAVKEKYPDIIVCGTAGPWSEGNDYEWGWRLAKDNNIDMIDEHYYQTPGWFIYHQDYYDQYDRNGSKVYLGEYAAHTPGRPNDIETALCEALHICGLERNGDVVAMSSYAPLLAKENHTQWNPDMIYFNNTEVKPTVGYYVQKLCGNCSGNEYIETSITLNEHTKGVRERLAASTVRDSITGKVYIKLVNVLNHSVNATLDMTSLTDSFKETESINAKLYVLTGNWDDKNAKPTESTISMTPTFAYELPAYSFTVIEL